MEAPRSGNEASTNRRRYFPATHPQGHFDECTQDTHSAGDVHWRSTVKDQSNNGLMPLQVPCVERRERNNCFLGQGEFDLLLAAPVALVISSCCCRE